MNRIARVVATALVVVAASGALTASPAFAKGGSGGGGGGSSQPPIGSYCPQDQWVVIQPDGSTIFANEASGAGCVFVHSYLSGDLRLDSVIVAPGWTYVVKSDGGGDSKNRVQLEFTNTDTGRKVDVRIEPGKTVIG